MYLKFAINIILVTKSYSGICLNVKLVKRSNCTVHHVVVSETNFQGSKGREWRGIILFAVEYIINDLVFRA